MNVILGLFVSHLEYIFLLHIIGIMPGVDIGTLIVSVTVSNFCFNYKYLYKLYLYYVQVCCVVG